MTNNWKDSLVEAVREFIRTGLLGGISSALGVVVLGLNTTTGEIAVNYQLAGVIFAFTALTALIRSLDKFVHEWNGTKLNGISPI